MDNSNMPSIDFSQSELVEISDAITEMIRKTLADGDAEMHEKKYGTLTLLQEAQGKIMPVAFGFHPDETMWGPEQTKRIVKVRQRQGLPDKATETERKMWAATVSRR
ncbi:hypothetical protein [Thiobacillus denitrificans]|uniref:hypothetical protein n=1 Tax=Thiobacillus denitrificans TaxID=36861 RepID=UPI0003722A79|nr:hypothetical protein [Thiobacillus denitrificans]